MDFVLRGTVQTAVNRQHFALPPFEIFGLLVGWDVHRPFQFGITRAHLLFVGALSVPQAVGGDGFPYRLDNVQTFGQTVNLSFG